ncbi:glycosyltransferase [Patescibacteria group bacterium]|nr:glycosyltransferase [Patescibacteria group bacterium]
MNSTSPLVSILMLTYNRAPYIGTAIESALNQTYQNFELIILDDGSTDSTAAVVMTYSDSRIKFLKDPTNKGLYRKRGESLTYATGTYVAILDSDDYWTDTTKLEKQVQYMETHPDCVVVGTFLTLVDTQNAEVGKNSYHTDDTSIRRAMLWRNQLANSSVLIRGRALSKTSGYLDLSPSEDYELFLQLGMHGGFANLSGYGTAYRIHTNSESARKMVHAQQILRTITLHRRHYPGFFLAYAKYSLLYVLARLGIK